MSVTFRSEMSSKSRQGRHVDYVIISAKTCECKLRIWKTKKDPDKISKSSNETIQQPTSIFLWRQRRLELSPKRAVHLKYHVYYLSWLYSFYTEENRVNYLIMNNKIQILLTYFFLAFITFSEDLPPKNQINT